MSEVTVVRSRDLKKCHELKRAVNTFFFNRMRKEKNTEKCAICLEFESSVGLGGAVVGVVLQALLLPIPLQLEEKTDERELLWLCVKCKSWLIAFSDLFLQLEAMRCHFNDLRRRLGKQVILGSLGRSEKEWTAWEKEVRRAENIYSCCVEEITQDDVKLNKMTPIVLLERLKQTTPTTSEATDSFSLEEELPVQQEDIEMKNPSESTEIDDILVDSELIVENVTSLSAKEVEEEEVEVILITNKLEYPCHRCDESFLTKYEVETHKAQVHERPRVRDANKLQCSVCSQQFTKRIELLQHEASVHSVVPPDTPDLPCSHCELTFPGPFTLKQHQLRNHFLGSSAAGDFQCAFCLQYFSDKSSRKRHRRTTHFRGLPRHKWELVSNAHLPRKICCSVCNPNEYFLRPKDLRNHIQSVEHKMKIHYKNSACCNKCELNFGEDLEALEAHLKNPLHQMNIPTLSRPKTGFEFISSSPEEDFQEMNLSIDLEDLQIHSNSQLHQQGVQNQSKFDPSSESMSISKEGEFQENNLRIVSVVGNFAPKSTTKEINQNSLVEFWRRKEKRLAQRKAARSKFNEIRINSIKSAILPETSSVHAIIPPQPSELSCSHCELTFPSSLTLKHHQVGEHLLGSIAAGDSQCRFCLQLFPDKSSNIRHERNAHYGGYSKFYRSFGWGSRMAQNIHCFICGTDERFTTQRALRIHAQCAKHKITFQSRRSAQCNVCKINFGLDLEGLRLHLKCDQHQKELTNPSNSDAIPEEVLSSNEEEFQETDIKIVAVAGNWKPR